MNSAKTLAAVVVAAAAFNALLLELGRRFGPRIRSLAGLSLLTIFAAALVGWQSAQRVQEGSPYVTAISVLIPGVVAMAIVEFLERKTDRRALVVGVSTCVTLIAFVVATVGAYPVWGP